MKNRPALLSLGCFAVLGWCLALCQDGEFTGKKKKKDKGGDEDGKLVKLLEKAAKKPETERDKMIKELTKLAPEDELRADNGAWFDRVAAGQATWDRQSISRMGLAEIFDRMADRMQDDSGRISRVQFLRYARTYWQEDNSPLWKEPKEIDLGREAEKMFAKLDRDGDGFLSVEEMPEALRAECRRWDRNGDGLIDLQEYLVYFPNRLQRLHQELQGLPPRQVAPPEDDDRPRVLRAGKLPPEIPAWFTTLDSDHDGQIALWEWRRAGWALEEFRMLDRNDDGFLEPAEMLRFIRAVERDDNHPLAHVLERKAPAPTGKSIVAGKRDKQKG